MIRVKERQTPPYKRNLRIFLFIFLILVLVVKFLYDKQYNVKFIFYKSININTSTDSNKDAMSKRWSFSDEINSDNILWWTVIKSKNDIDDPKNFIPVVSNLDLSAIDFDKYNAVLCVNRKINSINYIKSSYFPYMPKYSGTAVVHFNKILYKNTVFIYLIDKSEALRVEYKLPMKSQCTID